MRAYQLRIFVICLSNGVRCRLSTWCLSLRFAVGAKRGLFASDMRGSLLCAGYLLCGACCASFVCSDGRRLAFVDGSSCRSGSGLYLTSSRSGLAFVVASGCSSLGLIKV